MTDRDREYLEQMLRYAAAALQILGSADAVALAASEEKFLSVSKAIQNIGEAATKLSEIVRADLSEVPWKQIIGMRHHLVHAYESIRPDILVSTVRDDLPSLIAALRRALEEETR